VIYCCRLLPAFLESASAAEMFSMSAAEAVGPKRTRHSQAVTSASDCLHGSGGHSARLCEAEAEQGVIHTLAYLSGALQPVRGGLRRLSPRLIGQNAHSTFWSNPISVTLEWVLLQIELVRFAQFAWHAVASAKEGRSRSPSARELADYSES
jgi:hypothetical protein